MLRGPQQIAAAVGPKNKKPARWFNDEKDISPDMTAAPELWSGLTCLWPFWEGASTPRTIGPADGSFQSAPTWRRLPGGTAYELQGTSVQLTNDSRLKVSNPATFICYFEMIGSGNRGRLFCGGGANYNGLNFTFGPNNAMDLTMGDDSGTASADRKTFLTPNDSVPVGEPVAVVMIFRTFSDASIYINGVDQSLSTSGSATSLIWNSAAPQIGEIVNVTQANQRVYMQALYEREWSLGEIKAWSKDPYSMLRPAGF